MSTKYKELLLSALITLLLAFAANYWAGSVERAVLQEQLHTQQKITTELKAGLADVRSDISDKTKEFTDSLTLVAQAVAITQAKDDESKKVLERLDLTVDKLTQVVARLDERTKTGTNH